MHAVAGCAQARLFCCKCMFRGRVMVESLSTHCPGSMQAGPGHVMTDLQDSSPSWTAGCCGDAHQAAAHLVQVARQRLQSLPRAVQQRIIAEQLAECVLAQRDGGDVLQRLQDVGLRACMRDGASRMVACMAD